MDILQIVQVRCKNYHNQSSSIQRSNLSLSCWSRLTNVSISCLIPDGKHNLKPLVHALSRSVWECLLTLSATVRLLWNPRAALCSLHWLCSFQPDWCLRRNGRWLSQGKLRAPWCALDGWYFCDRVTFLSSQWELRPFSNTSINHLSCNNPECRVSESLKELSLWRTNYNIGFSLNYFENNGLQP